MLLQKVEPAQDAPASSDVSNVRKRAFHTFQSFGKRIPGHLVEHLPALLARASTAAARCSEFELDQLYEGAILSRLLASSAAGLLVKFREMI